MTTWFSADLHIGHANIIKYCNRPFSDVDEMNKTIIKNFQAKIKPGDELFILGDFAFDSPEKWARLIPGNKFLIFGNHDLRFRNKFVHWGFAWAKDVFELRVPDENISIWMSHYAHRTWPKRHHGAWHLYGHSHGKMPGEGLSTDVGVDCWNFSPVSLQELGDYFKDKDKGASGPDL